MKKTAGNDLAAAPEAPGLTAGAGKVKPQPPCVQISQRMFLGLLLAVALPYLLLIGGLTVRPAWLRRLMSEEKATAGTVSAHHHRTHSMPSKSGPWGRLEYIPIYIECPEEFLNVRSYESVERRWVFKNMTPEELKIFFAGTALDEKQMRELSDTAKWEIKPGIIHLNPSRELRLSLSAAAARRIYPVMAEASEAFRPISIPADKFEEFFEGSGVAPETQALVKRLCYPHGSRLFLSSLPLILDTLPDYDDKVRLLKVLSRKPSLLAHLNIAPTDDVKALVRYWTKACWGKDIEPFLESMAKIPGGVRISIMHLLPPWPTGRLNTFPLPSAASSPVNEDCHWTSFNFFRDTPDPRFGDLQFVGETLKKDYFPVDGDPTYGDVIAFVRPNGFMIHSAVFIADDVAYTKNGAHYLQPWMLMRISDLEERYGAVIPEGEKLAIRYFRNKYL